jgi:aryl-alcohol dehydrogenase-like predicted oxidoreductase
MSTIVIFGAFAVGQLNQREADETMELILAHGVNHIDVAPSYHEAELRLGPWLERHRDDFFVGCKTQLRDRREAREELHRSLERLRIDTFDLFQLHAVTTMDELEQCFAPGGSLEAIVDARREGLTRYIGITSHGMEAPAVLMEALDRFDMDSILFPVNGRMWADGEYRRQAEALLQKAAEKDVGSMAIKAVARGPWDGRPQRYHTWYEPLEDPQAVERALRFTLSQPVTGAISAGDARLLPAILDAAERFRPMETAEQAEFVGVAEQYGQIF